MQTEKITEQQAYEIGVEAYQYLYPLVLRHGQRIELASITPFGGARCDHAPVRAEGSGGGWSVEPTGDQEGAIGLVVLPVTPAASTWRV